MLKTLTSKTLTQRPSGYIVWLDHTCAISTSGSVIQDKLGHFHSFEGDMHQFSSGLRNGRISIDSGTSDLLSFSIFFRFRSESKTEKTLMLLNDDFTLGIKNNVVSFSNGFESFFNHLLDSSWRSGYDFTFGLTKTSGSMSFYVDGHKESVVSIYMNESARFTLQSDSLSYLDHIFIYDRCLNETQMTELSSSFISSSSMLDSFGYLSTDQTLKMG